MTTSPPPPSVPIPPASPPGGPGALPPGQPPAPPTPATDAVPPARGPRALPLSTWWFGIGAFAAIAFVVAFLAASDTANAGFKDAAAVIAFVGTVSVGIERIIELLFSIVDGTARLGGWWPLAVVQDEFDSFEQRTRDLLGPPTDAALAALRDARQKAADGSVEAANLDGQIAALQAGRQRLASRLDTVQQTLAPGSGRLALVAEIATEASTRASAALDAASSADQTVRIGLTDATELADRALAIVQAFRDNPARQIASLAIGAGLGMLVAGFVDVNLFAAILGSPAGASATAGPQGTDLLAGRLGVVLTGLAVGLGSGPTHEVIQALQQYKQSRKQIDLPTPSGAPASAADAVRRTIRATN